MNDKAKNNEPTNANGQTLSELAASYAAYAVEMLKDGSSDWQDPYAEAREALHCCITADRDDIDEAYHSALAALGYRYDFENSLAAIGAADASAIETKLAPVAVEFNLPASAVADYLDAFADELDHLASLDAGELRHAFLRDFVQNQDYPGVDVENGPTGDAAAFVELCKDIADDCAIMASDDVTDADWHSTQYAVALKWDDACAARFEAWNGRKSAATESAAFKLALDAVRSQF